jgi:glycosyltransferase involved in cell wall biosynthesis
VLLILARLFPISYSLTIHGSGEFNDVVGFHMAQKVAEATFVATISHYGCSQVMRASDPMHWHRVRVIPLGVDPAEFSPRPSPTRAPGEPFRLVSIGQLAPAKAQALLIQAVALVSAGGRNVELTIVGEGSLRPNLERLVGELGLGSRVLLVGACNHDRVADYYRRSDAFVLASFAEGVPVVLMEAMAMAVPCVATWITGIPELIVGNVEGLLVPPASVEALAEAIARLMDDPALALRIGAAGRQKVLSQYNIENNAQCLGAALREAI